MTTITPSTKAKPAYLPYAILVAIFAVAMVLIGEHLPAVHYAWPWQVPFYAAWVGGLASGSVCLYRIWLRR